MKNIHILSPPEIPSRHSMLINVTFIPDYTAANPYQRILAEELKKLNVHVKFANSSNYLLRLSSVFRCKPKPDILHLHWTESLWVSHRLIATLIRGIFFTFELLLARLKGTKLVWTMHNLVKHDTQAPQIEKVFNSIFCTLYNKVIVHCNTARYIALRELFLPKRYDNRFQVIPHASYLGYYENRISSSVAREKLNIKISETVFLFFGVIRPYKGIVRLIHDLKELPEQTVKLLIVGKPINKEFRQMILEEAISDDRIQCHLRYIADDEIQLFMNAADAVVLPYQNILTSGAAYLAMSFGKAVIAPSIGCNIDFDTEGAILYDSDRPGGLVKALRKALRLPLEDMGRYNLRKSQELNWPNIAYKTSLLYREVLSGRQRQCS